MSFLKFPKKRILRKGADHQEGNSSYIPLYLLLTVVNDGQGSAIVRLVRSFGASSSFVCHGRGTASNDFYEVFGLTHSEKQIVLTPLRADMYPNVRKGIVERFDINESSKGISVLLPISSVIGKNAYRLLSDERVALEPKGAKELMDATPMKKDFEVIVAIVNDGYTDLVMDAAKAAGARGGTILTAKGTGNKDIEQFFGVVIAPEKQIVLIVVPKNIKDAVISAIYKDVGLNSKGQGIVFSLPTTDVLGIAEEREEEKVEEPKEKEPSLPSSDEPKGE